MKKNKIILGLGSIAAVTAPIIAVVSCGNSSSVAMNHNEGSRNMAAAVAATNNIATAPVGLDGRGDVIDESNQNDLRAVESRLKPKTTGWVENYTPREFKNMLPEQWYANALRDGWTSVEDYVNYMIYVYEKGALATKSSNTFGDFVGDANSSWLGFYYGPGNDLPFWGKAPYNFNGDWKANISEMSPVWRGASKEKYNNIDNSLSWFHYEGGDPKQFLFDEKNIDNGIKRLEHMKRLRRVDLNALMDESVGEGENKIYRNYVMLDGKLTNLDDLPIGVYNLYYVCHDSTDDPHSFVRDDHGWPVVVTDRDKKKMLTQVINPTSSDTLTRNPQIASRDVNHTHPLYAGAQRAAAKTVDYPSDYTSVAEFTVDKQSKIYNTDEAHYIGRYTITQSADSFEGLLDNPLVHLPYRDCRGDQAEFTTPDTQKSTNIPDRFGRVGKYYPLYGADQLHHMAWAWVEDGHGGHKIWKSMLRLRHVLDLFGDGTHPSVERQLQNLSRTEGVSVDELRPCKGHGEYRFWGNYQRIYLRGEWFRNSEYWKAEEGL